MPETPFASLLCEPSKLMAYLRCSAGDVMPNHELLNSEQHRHLRVRQRPGADPHFVQIVPAEFVAAAANCPILLTKHPQTGEFYVGAMFGFRAGETLLENAAARGGFEPLGLLRDGFFIAGESIAVDVDHPRFSTTEGDPLFDDALMPSTELRHVQRVLGQVQSGIEQSDAFVRALLQFKLIEPIDITLRFNDSEQLVLQGLYTVSLDRFRELDDADVLQLVRAGHAQLMYLMNMSLHQISRLASLRNARCS
ncbi:MAG TPA: SapC family protein [Steroidobacteraceae bacterium]|nr:SapC family protein [Steroidobacteraceae bacterium]